MNTRPTIPAPYHPNSDLRAYAWMNRLAGFGVGVLLSSAWWIAILYTFRR